MKSLLFCLVASAALFGAPALAQDHIDHHARTDVAVTPKPMSEMDDAEMHAHCKALMGHKMDGRVPHDHSVEKLGHVPPPAKPISQAEMKQQHDKCTAMMGDAAAHLKPK